MILAKDKKQIFFLALFVLIILIVIVGKFFIAPICCSIKTNAVDTIDSQVQSELQKLSYENAKVVFYPTSRDVSVKKGDDPKGFAFSISNNDVEEAAFSFVTEATDASKCGSTFDEEDANSMLLGGSGTVNIGPGDVSEGRLVNFVVPESAPKCTVEYTLTVDKGSVAYGELNFFLIIK